MDSETLLKLEQMIEKIAMDRCSCCVYDIEFKPTGLGRTLTIYLDRPQGPPVDLEACTEVSRGVNLLLDVENIIPGGAYHLEVSSPGLERNLKKPWHFNTAVGKKIFLQTFEKMENYGVENHKLKPSRKAQVFVSDTNEEGIFISEERFSPPTRETEMESTESSHLDLKGDLKGDFIPFGGIQKSHLIFENEETHLSGNKKSSERIRSQKKKTMKRKH